MNPGILEGLQAHGASGDTTSMERLPGNHKDELPLIYFVPIPHHLCYLVLILIYLLLSVSSLSVLDFLPPPHRSFFKPFEAGAMLSLARNLLSPESSTEVKRVTLSRQARAIHNRPFSWSVLRH